MKPWSKYESPRVKLVREAFETIINEEEPRGILYKLLDKIQEKTHPEGKENVWIFDSEDLSKEIPDADQEKLNYILQFLFSIKEVNKVYPSLNKPLNAQKYTALPKRFSSSKVEDTKRRFEILVTQRKLREYIQKNIPHNNVVLNKNQIKEAESILAYLKGLHEKTIQRRTWEEVMIAYLMLKSKLKRNPTENEVSEILGLLDHRIIRGRRKLSKEIEKYKLKLEFSYSQELLFKKRKKQIKQAIRKLKKRGIIPTVQRIAKEVEINECQVRRYVKRLKLKVVDGVKVSYIEKTQKVKNTYEELKNEFPPTAIEIAEKTNIYRPKVIKICKEQGLKLLPYGKLGLRIMYRYIKDLMDLGVDISELTDLILQDYMDSMGDYFSYNTVKKWRKALETMKLIPESRRRRERRLPPKHAKYQEAYLKLVKEKVKKKERIVLKRIAEELSRKFGEMVPEHRVHKLRDVTGIPVLLDNEARYQNIVNVYNKNPEFSMEDWAEKAKVSIGFLYDALRQFKKHPDLRKKFGVSYEMLNRLKTRENPMIKAFRAIGNTNRVKILKCLIEEDDITLGEILERLEYNSSKWRDTFEYHLEVLEDAGIVSITYYNRIVLTSLGEDIVPHIEAWDIGEIVPEEIFGPGYNKPLFMLAIGKGDIKALKKIVEFMRRKKGLVPFKVPSAVSSERGPLDYKKHRFLKYLDNFLGRYQIKEEYLPFLGPLILDVRDFFSPRHIPIPRLCKIKGVRYGRVRDITFSLVDRGSVDELYLQMAQEEALKYMRFIKNNFFAICQRMKLDVPSKIVKLKYDRLNEMYTLMLS